MSEDDRAVLDYARDHRLTPHDHDEIRRNFGSIPRFYQRLGQVLEMPEALAADPQLVYRLRAIRDRRAGSRGARVLRTAYGAESPGSRPWSSGTRP